MKILNIQRMSTEDGPGLRTTVFAKGCPLSCRWCHNPESISPRSHAEWFAVRCIGCRTCQRLCPKGIRFEPEGLVLPEDCDACGRCTENCPTGALEIKGQDMSPEELFRELMKDRAYWGRDGGVTLSGGEITLQWQEAEKLLALLKAEGVQTAVDTCGFCGRQALEALLPYTDLFLYDLKLFDEQKHIRYTGRSNRVIFENYRWLAEEAEKRKVRIWVRTPIIPGATDTDENISGLAGIIKDSAERWELLSFNNLCRDKYDRINKEWEYSKAELMTAGRMQALTELAKRSGCSQTVWSGVTRLKNRSDE